MEDGEGVLVPVGVTLAVEVGDGVCEGTITHSVWSTLENNPGGHGSQTEDPAVEMLPLGQEIQRKPD